MWHAKKVMGLTCLVLLGTSLPCMAALNFQFIKIDFPGAVKTSPYGINNRMIMVGEYVAVDGSSHGFLWDSGVFTPLDFPGAIYTSAKGINDAGAVVGDFLDPSRKRHGFLYVRGSFSQLDFPDSTMTSARVINSRGDIVGLYTVGGYQSAYILSSGRYSELPGTREDFQRPRGINDAGSIVGWYSTGPGDFDFAAYLYNNGIFAYYDFRQPGSMLWDINNAGCMIGGYVISDGSYFNVLWTGMEWTDLPVFRNYKGPLLFTQYLGFNDVGSYVGTYGTNDNTEVHGFLAVDVRRR